MSDRAAAYRPSLRDLADEDLMQLVQRAQASAFEVVYDRHAGAAFSLAYRMCGARQFAEEVVQEAFLSIWRSGARYDRSRGSVRTWILGITHHRAIDVLRRGLVQDRHRASDEGIEERFEAEERTDVEVARREEALEVRGALDGLPQEQRRAIELAYYGGFTQSEIAEMLGVPIGTVKGRMRLGMEKMRGQLAPPAEVLP
ncbi:MAG TPA: sigma-70 family RNA polymerase sigma factor [Conexibacter sp.]|jgi:RNA polymerase sigma-70 factor (ECF subfamily)|nr:sigma-70 family RNA polymerase sigma factor [Conexibacter sp.]